MKIILNICFVTLTLILLSCQSAVRFSSDNSYSSKVSKASTKSKTTLTIEDKNEIIKVAESWIGVPYVYGGDNRNGIDCSAFVQNVYKEVGINLPRTSEQQYDYSDKIDTDNRKPGDLIFFSNKGKVSHVGIFVGDNDMIHASTSKGVIRQNLSEYYFYTRYYATGRIIP